MANSGKVGRVLTQKATDPVAFTDEVTAADVTNTIFTIADESKQYWDRNSIITVKKNSVIQTTGFKIAHPIGSVIFDSPQEGATVTISGKYVEVEQLAGFFNWSLSIDNKTIDTTCFESGEWEEFILSTKSWNASADKFWASTDDFTQRLGSENIVVLYTDFVGTKICFVGYACINSDAVDVAVNDVIKDKITFTGTEKIYFKI
jgi:hypothetical protein